MPVKRIIKSAGVGIAVAIVIFIFGVGGEVAWVTFGLPGVHWVKDVPTIDAATTTDDRSTTVSESHADISFVPVFVATAIGLVGGFSWAFGRNPRKVGGPW